MIWVCPSEVRLNDINGFHVKPEHVVTALNSARSGPVPEGNVGGGTGMICYEFKGGTGTSSRRVRDPAGEYTVGVLVQANFGSRHQFTVAGIPVGKEIPEEAAYAARTVDRATTDVGPNDRMSPLFEATVDATEEAILNAMVAAETMTGANGHRANALPHDRLQELLRKHSQLTTSN